MELTESAADASSGGDAKATRSVAITGGRFLIVGGASLLGSASAELFLANGRQPLARSLAALKHIGGNPGLKIVPGDVMRLPQLIAAMFHTLDAPPAAILYGASKIIGEQLCGDAQARSMWCAHATVWERQHYRAANAL